MADLIGQQIGGYRLLRLIGRGRIGNVYLAEHVHLGRVVAIKVLEELPDDALKAFEMEAGTIADLKHPHILTILDFGVIDKAPFLVMEYASNGSLSDRHPRGSQLPLATVVEYVKPIAEALQYMHNENLLHLDVNPGNVFIGRDNEILLSEPDIAFISLSMRTQTVSEEISGTPLYMAPEQITGSPGPATDQYALGITVYEWLSGRRPFEGSAMALFAQQRFAPPPSLRMQAPLISSAVEAVVMRALVKQPEERFPTISDFAWALEQAALSDKGYVGTASTQVDSSETLTPVSPPYSTSPESLVPLLPTSDTGPTTSTNTQEFEVLKRTGIPLLRDTSRRALITSGLVGLAGLVGAEIFASDWRNGSTATLSASTLGDTVFVYPGHAGAVLSVAWSPKRNLIASAGRDNKVQIWTGPTGEVSTVYNTSNLPYAVAWSPDSDIAFSDGNQVEGWVSDVSNGVVLQIFYKEHSGSVYSIAWSPDSRRIASASQDRTVRVWDVSPSNTLFSYRRHSGSVNSVAWSSDSKRIASAGQDKTVQVWDASDGANPFVYKGHSDVVTSVAWSPDSRRIASACQDRTVRVWDASNGAELLVYGGHSSIVASVAWSPDGRYIVSASDDHTVQVWDASSGTLLITYTGHSGVVTSVAWSHDGKYIASGSLDKTVRVWRAS